MKTLKVQFRNNNDYLLSARMEFPPDKHPVAYAIFAHVFTGSKNLAATRYISRSLTQHGIAVLRFDFTGLGESEGDFADTNFTSNVDDLLAAAQFLDENYRSPSVLVGHSLGGAAVIFAASQISTIKAVATIGAPSEPEHVTHLLEDKIEKIESTGMAKVTIGGRSFKIKKQFLDDLRTKNMFGVLRTLRKPILVLHSPQDTIVEIENAAKIYHAAYHPKSFVSLDGADHMLSQKSDAFYVGEVVGTWLSRYVEYPPASSLATDKEVVARLGNAGYTTEILAGAHPLLADEGEEAGGDDFGPSPYQLLSSALAACKAMTMQMYARRKKWRLEDVEVHINYSRRYFDDCQDCENQSKKIDHFDCAIVIEGDLDQTQRDRLMEIAGRCPVHKTLQNEIRIESRLVS